MPVPAGTARVAYLRLRSGLFFGLPGVDALVSKLRKVVFLLLAMTRSSKERVRRAHFAELERAEHPAPVKFRRKRQQGHEKDGYSDRIIREWRVRQLYL